MCGILGSVTQKEVGTARAEGALREISHRGPDSEGKFNGMLFRSSVFLGHKRLSIIDLSSHGAQPFHSKDERYVLTYNGEIYNFLELRAELEKLGEVFETDSDTEVLLCALSLWGTEALQRLEGMFAFALLDKHRGTLLLARDAFGVKPLYYIFKDQEFFFASEPAALLKLSQIQPEINHFQAIGFFLDGKYDQGSETFFKNIYQVLPGEYLKLNLETLRLSREQWLSIDTLAAHQEQDTSIRSALQHSVKIHLRSDVPIAAALSGGIDSTVLSALIQGALDEPLTTFGFCSNNPVSNEEKWQVLASERLELKHNFVRQEPSDTYSDLIEQIKLMGEPFGSTSILAQRAVFRSIANSGFKVSLDGQGADELFGGYEGYPQAKFLTMPFAERAAQFQEAAYFSSSARGSRWTFFAETCAEILGLSHAKNWLRRLLRIMTVSRARASKVSARWLIAYICHNQRHVNVRQITGNSPNFLVTKLAQEVWITSLPALLKHADRNSMVASIESRVPFLTLRVASAALRAASKRDQVKLGKKTQLLADIGDLVPPEIRHRKDKVGFTGNEFSFSSQSTEEQIQNLAALRTLPWIKIQKGATFPPDTWSSDSIRDFRLLMLALWIRNVINSKEGLE